MSAIRTRSLHRSPDLKLRAAKGESKVRVMEGHAAVFGVRSCNLGWFFEIIERGAFTEALKDPDMECYSLFNHEESRVLGVNTNGSLRMEEDKIGLYQETDLLGDTTDSSNMIAHLDAQRISKMSFAFTIAPDGQQWDEDKDGLLISTVTRAQRLYDVSPVTYPAYAATEVGLRSVPGMTATNINNMMAIMTRAENGLAVDKDQLAQLKAVRAEVEKLITRAEEKAEKPDPVGASIDELQKRFYRLFL